MLVAAPLLLLLLVAALSIGLRRKTRRTFRRNAVGFLHADASNGGGGERVLWVAIDQIQRDDEMRGIAREYVLYTNALAGHGSGGSGKDSEVALLAVVHSQFHIRPPRKIKVVCLRRSVTQWLRADKYPRFTLLLQTVVGGLALFYESSVVNAATPLVVETVGVPMVYPLLRVLAGCRVVSYTHFPIVSSSMMERVRAGTTSTTNAGVVVSNPLLRTGKLVYYQLLTVFYKFLGQFPSLVFTNSSWTQGHVSALFWPRECIVLYPPCDVIDFSSRSKAPELRQPTIVSVGQFRPEKNHMLQLRSFHRAVRAGLPADARLVMLGGARDPADQGRADAVVCEAQRLGIADRVDVIVNAAFDDVVSHLTGGCVGLHTMLDEHFGIVVLEYLAAGIIPMAHGSGGVKLDIVTSSDIGFLGTSEDDFAKGMIAICKMRAEDPDRYRRFQERGAAHVRAFSDAAFGAQLSRHLRPLLE